MVAAVVATDCFFFPADDGETLSFFLARGEEEEEEEAAAAIRTSFPPFPPPLLLPLGKGVVEKFFNADGASEAEPEASEEREVAVEGVRRLGLLPVHVSAREKRREREAGRRVGAAAVAVAEVVVPLLVLPPPPLLLLHAERWTGIDAALLASSSHVHRATSFSLSVSGTSM